MKTKGTKPATKKGFILQPTDDVEVVPLTYGSKVITMHPFESKKGYRFKTLKKKIAKYIKQYDGRAMVTAKFNGVPRSGRWVNTKHPNKDLILYDPERHKESWDDPDTFFNIDSDRIYEFDIYIEEDAGGCEDEFNDCLQQCLEEAFNGMLPKYNDPYYFKKAMGLKRRALVPISALDKLEEELRVNINVSGDATRTSKTTHYRTVWLKLRKHHYTLLRDPRRKPVWGCWDKPRKPFVYKKTKLGYLVYRKRKEELVTEKELREMKQCYKPIKFDTKMKTLKQHLHTYKKERKRIIAVSNGRIDPNKHYSVGKGTLDLWQDFIKGVAEPEAIDTEEADFIRHFICGGFSWASKYEGKAYNYDINHFYPSMMAERVMIPHKRGELKTIDELPDYVQFGLYRCEIEKREWDGVPLFMYYKHNRYTHYDIRRARELGLKVTMCDLSPNCEVWSGKQLIRSDICFKDYIEWIYEMKQKESGVKGYGNALWGALMKPREYYDDVELGKKGTKLKKDRDILEFVRVGKKISVKYTVPNIRFETNWARLAPFLTSYGRYNMSKYVEKNAKHLVKVHIDSLTSKTPLELPLSKELGGWKLDKMGRVKIKGITSIEWTTKDDDARIWRTGNMIPARYFGMSK